MIFTESSVKLDDLYFTMHILNWSIIMWFSFLSFFFLNPVEHHHHNNIPLYSSAVQTLAPRHLTNEWNSPNCWSKTHLVPGLLVQLYAHVQWDALHQFHGEHPLAWQLINHLGDLEKLISLQQWSKGRGTRESKKKTKQKKLNDLWLGYLQNGKYAKPKIYKTNLKSHAKTVKINYTITACIIIK